MTMAAWRDGWITGQSQNRTKRKASPDSALNAERQDERPPTCPLAHARSPRGRYPQESTQARAVRPCTMLALSPVDQEPALRCLWAGAGWGSGAYGAGWRHRDQIE